MPLACSLTRSGSFLCSEIDELGFDPTGLVAWYRLDGDAQDSSGNGHHGTVTGDVVPAADRFGREGGAMCVPGPTDGYITLPATIDTALAAGQDFTISFWWRSVGVDISADHLVSNYRSSGNVIFWYTVSDSLNILACVSRSTGMLTHTWMSKKDQQWHQLILTREGTTLRQYCDGVLGLTNTVPENAESFAQGAMRIFAALSGGASRGLCDGLLLFSRALTANEIAVLYRHERGRIGLSVLEEVVEQ